MKGKHFKKNNPGGIDSGSITMKFMIIVVIIIFVSVVGEIIYSLNPSLFRI